MSIALAIEVLREATRKLQRRRQRKQLKIHGSTLPALA